jgi:hypothetical protein
MSKLTYTETTTHGPEVDFGVHWTRKGESRTYRVTWVAYDDAKQGWSERGDVSAFAADGTTVLLGRDIPLFVVEHFLSQPYNSVGVNIDRDECGWAVATCAGADITWVEKRLARWNGCDVVTYTGKERYGAEEKAARQYAWRWSFEARKGGWIYDSRGRAFTQGWRSFAGDLRASRVIVPVRQDRIHGDAAHGVVTGPARYSETWVVSTTKITFGG